MHLPVSYLLKAANGSSTPACSPEPEAADALPVEEGCEGLLVVLEESPLILFRNFFIVPKVDELRTGKVGTSIRCNDNCTATPAPL